MAEKQTEIDATSDWRPEVLEELRKRLAATPEHFTEDRLRIAHAATYRKSLVDIISMVKHAAKEEEPLLTSAERVERAFIRLTRGRAFTEPQSRWLDRIREHLVQNLSIDRDDFDSIPVLPPSRRMGRGESRLRRAARAVARADQRGHRRVAGRISYEMRGDSMTDVRRFTAMIYREGDGYVALCPELDVASQGDNVEDASANLREAVELFLETAAPSEIERRMTGEMYVTALEVTAG